MPADLPLRMCSLAEQAPLMDLQQPTQHTTKLRLPMVVQIKQEKKGEAETVSAAGDAVRIVRR